MMEPYTLYKDSRTFVTCKNENKNTNVLQITINLKFENKEIELMEKTIKEINEEPIKYKNVPPCYK